MNNLREIIIDKLVSDKKYISLTESGKTVMNDSEKNSGNQHVIDEHYEDIPYDFYLNIKNMRKGAIIKYGAGSHLKLDLKDTIGRAMRHVLTSVTMPSSKEETHTDDILHIILRLCMCIDKYVYSKLCGHGIQSKEFADAYSDFRDTFEMYNKGTYPNLQMFPSVMRRVSIFYREISQLCNDIPYMDILDNTFDILLETANKIDDALINKFTLLIASLIVVYDKMRSELVNPDNGCNMSISEAITSNIISDFNIGLAVNNNVSMITDRKLCNPEETEQDERMVDALNL